MRWSILWLRFRRFWIREWRSWRALLADLRLRRHLYFVDPVFGELNGELVEYKGESYVTWVADRRFCDHGQDAAIFLTAGVEGPTQHQRELYGQLRSRFEELRAAMEQPLAQAYEEIRVSWQTDGMQLTQSCNVWGLIQLKRIDICDSSRQPLALWLTFSLPFDIDHDLSVEIADWRVANWGLEG